MKTLFQLSGVLLGGSLLLGSCKPIHITPDTLAGAYHDIQDAQKELTDENEYYVGRSVATTILAKNSYKYVDSSDWKNRKLGATTKYVNQVGALVAAAALEESRAGDRPAPIAGFHFVVLESDQINAFAAPGGFVFVTAGALAAAKSEDELAAILSHEVAHVVRGHALGTIKKSRWAGIGKDWLKKSGALDESQLGELSKVFEGAMNDMVDALLVKGYSRDTEFEADRVGMAIMSRAGYDTGAFLRYLETLRSKQSTGSGGFYATHPAASDRIGKLKTEQTKVGGTRDVPPVRIERFAKATAHLKH